MFFNRRKRNLISQFRGLPLDWSHSTEKSEAPLDSLVETLLEKHKIGQKTPEEALMESWASIIGQSMCHKCAPTKIDATGTLIVRVNNQMDRRELEFRRRAITGKIQRLEGCHIVKRVLFIAG